MGNGSVKPRKNAEILRCTICFNVYRIPRMLPCQHTFCEACLKEYIMRTLNHEEHKLEFPCPICRDVTKIKDNSKPRDKWAKQFPKNRLLISLFEEDSQRSESCNVHPGKLIEFFCSDHVEIGCSSCLLTRHQSCAILPLEEYIKGGKFKRACQKSNDLLLQYRKLFEDIAVDVNTNQDKLDSKRSMLVDAVKSRRKQLDNLLDDLEEKLIASVNENHRRENELLNERNGRCRTIIVDINTAIEQISAAQGNINKVRKADIIVSVDRKLNAIGTKMCEEHGDFKSIEMDLTFDPLVEQLQTSLEALGKIEIERTKTTLKLPTFVPHSYAAGKVDKNTRRNKHVAKVGEHSVSGNEESFFCNITSTSLLDNGDIVLVDDSNCKVKLMTGRFKLKAELKLESNPLNIAHITDTEVAVSLPGNREIVFISIQQPDTLSVNRTISTRLDCWGLAMLDNTLIVTTGRDGHSVLFLDFDGKETHSVLLTQHADENIRCPVAVIGDPKRKVLYITCTGGAWSKGCVITMDLNGKITHTFVDPNLDTPRSCSLDRHGKLYICGLESSSVFQVVPGGEVFRVFPSRTEQVVGPLHVNFLYNYHIRFLLTEVASDKLKVFELPTQK